MANLLSSNLVFLRKEKKLSQFSFANWLEVKRTTYSNWESGHAEPPISALQHISSKLEISIDFLINQDLLQRKVENEIPIIDNKMIKGKVRGKVLNNNKDSQSTETLVEFVDNKIMTKEQSAKNNRIDNVYCLDNKSLSQLPLLVKEQALLKDIPMLFYPDLSEGLHFRFRVTSDNMHPTLAIGDFVIITYLPVPETVLYGGKIFIYSDQRDNLHCRRVYNFREFYEMEHLTDFGEYEFELTNDNPKYPASFINFEHLKEVFEVIEIHTREMSKIQMREFQLLTNMKKEIERLKKNNTV